VGIALSAVHGTVPSMATTFDFTGLTEDQQALLTFQGWEPGGVLPQPTPQTVRKLIDRGLVVPYTVEHAGLDVRAYAVPIDVHMAWCAWCAEHLADDDAE
jgi:hypothetical protein